MARCGILFLPIVAVLLGGVAKLSNAEKSFALLKADDSKSIGELSDGICNIQMGSESVMTPEHGWAGRGGSECLFIY